MDINSGGIASNGAPKNNIRTNSDMAFIPIHARPAEIKNLQKQQVSPQEEPGLIEQRTFLVDLQKVVYSVNLICKKTIYHF